jgi:hypothetical protein
MVAPSGAAADGSDLAFGSTIAGSIVGIVLLSVGLVFLGIAGAIVLFIIRLTRSRRARAQPGACARPAAGSGAPAGAAGPP